MSDERAQSSDVVRLADVRCALPGEGACRSAEAAARANERERCAQEVDGPGYGTAAIRLRHLAQPAPTDAGGRDE